MSERMVPMPSPTGRNDNNLFIPASFLRPFSGTRCDVRFAYDAAGGRQARGKRGEPSNNAKLRTRRS
jgi:hypothetical protein